MSELSLDSLIERISIKDAQQDMTKVASADAATELENALLNNVGENNTMTKSAHEQAGQSIAEAILAGLTKQAENNVIAETSTMVAEDDKKVLDTPVAGRTVNEVAKDLIARAGANGKTHVPELPAQIAAAEGGAQTAGRDPVPSNLDKQASETLSALISDGVPFEEAVELVKEAAAILNSDLEKSAAVSHLIDNGVDFENAVALVKQASEEDEYTELEKSAAVNELVSQGYAFEDAVAAINDVIAGQ